MISRPLWEVSTSPCTRRSLSQLQGQRCLARDYGAANLSGVISTAQCTWDITGAEWRWCDQHSLVYMWDYWSWVKVMWSAQLGAHETLLELSEGDVISTAQCTRHYWSWVKVMWSAKHSVYAMKISMCMVYMWDYKRLLEWTKHEITGVNKAWCTCEITAAKWCDQQACRTCE